MKQNNKKFNNAMHKFVGVLDKYDALTTNLIKRGYQHRFVKEEIDKVRQIPRSKALETSTKHL